MIQPPAQRSRRSGSRPLAIVIAALVGVLTLHVAAQPVRVSGASMTPFAADGAQLLVNTVSMVARGDVVVAQVPAGWTAATPERVVKRVIAIGGDRISCCERGTGALVRNGERLDEPYLADPTSVSSLGFDVRVPDGHVWLLGDNRSTSLDSRAHVFDQLSGAVPRSRVLGVVWARFPPAPRGWPF